VRQISYSLKDFVSDNRSGIPDAVLSEEDLNNLKILAGVKSNINIQLAEQQVNLTHTAMEKVNYMKENNIQPGTQEWFRLWFSRPYLTGDNGMSIK
jgi:hypothetical protein